MNFLHGLSVAFIMALFFFPSRLPAQTGGASAPSNNNSPYSIVRSVESIGNEILSLFSSDADQKAAPANAAPGRATGGKRPRKVYVWLVAGVHSAGDAAGQCQSGNGICTFSISLTPNDGLPNAVSIPAQANYFPRQKRLVLQFESPLDAQFNGADGKAVLSVHRNPSDSSDLNGTIVVKNKRLLIAEGDYTVQNSTVSLNIQ